MHDSGVTQCAATDRLCVFVFGSQDTGSNDRRRPVLRAGFRRVFYRRAVDVKRTGSVQDTKLQHNIFIVTQVRVLLI